MSAIGDVTGTMSLDTAQFEAGMKRAAASAGASADAIAKSEKKSAEARAAAAKYAADTITEQGRRELAARNAVAQAAQDRRKLESDLKNGYIDEATGVNAITAALQREAAARKEIAAIAAADKHTGFNQQQGASAFLRGGGMRAEERFLSMIPGVGAGLQSVGMAFGGVALAKTVVDAGEKVYDFEQRMKDAGQTARDEWGSINAEIGRTGDGLAVAGDKLDITLAKLQHRPADFLKLALDEERKSIADIGAEAEMAQKKIAAMFKEHGVSGADQFGSTVLDASARALQGVLQTFAPPVASLTARYLSPGVQMSTKPDQDFIDRQEKIISGSTSLANRRLVDAKPGAEADAIRAVNRNAELAANDNTIERTKQHLQELYDLQRKNAGGPEDYSGRTSNVESYIAQLQERRSNLAQGFHNDDTQVAIDKRERAKADATAAAEATRKAAEAQWKGMEAELHQRQKVEEMSLGDILGYWESQQSAATKYAANVDKVDAKIVDAKREYYRKLDEMAAQAVEAQKRSQAEQLRVAEELIRRLDRADKAGADAQADVAAANAKNAAEMDKLTLAHDVATGVISKYDQAVQLAKIHSAEYGAEIDRLRAKKSDIDNDPDMLDQEKDAAKRKIDAQIILLQGDAARTAASDRYAAASETMWGGASKAVGEFVAQLRDYSGQMHSLTQGLLNGTNANIIKAITGQKTDFTGTAREAATRVAGLGLSKLETSAFDKVRSLFGDKGKKTPDGTSDDPLHVVIARASATKDAADAIGSGDWGAAAKLFSQTNASGDEAYQSVLRSMSSRWNAGDGSPVAKAAQMVAAPDNKSSVFGSIFGTLAKAVIPGFAGGGAYPAGTLAMFGEHGPELGVIGSNAHIFTAPQTRSMLAGGGGSPTIHVHVDARGSVSPAMVASAARQAAHEGARQGHEMAMHSMTERHRRQIGLARASR